MICPFCHARMFRSALIRKEEEDGVIYYLKVMRDECGGCGTRLELSRPDMLPMVIFDNLPEWLERRK